MPSCWNGRRCLVILCLSTPPPHCHPPPLPLSALLCVLKDWPCSLSPRLSCWLAFVGLVNGKHQQEMGVWKVKSGGVFSLLLCALCPMIQVGTVPALMGSGLSSVVPLGPGRGRLGCLLLDPSPSIVASSTLYMSLEIMSTESLHLFHLCNLPGPWLTHQCPCTDLLAFLYESPAPWWLLSNPCICYWNLVNTDCSFSTYSGLTGPPWLTRVIWASLGTQTLTEFPLLLSSLASGSSSELHICF